MNLKAFYLSRRTAGILFLFMTLLMGFPFFFYYRYSSLESNVLATNRVRIGEFGMELRRSLENLPPEELDRETAVAMFLLLPLVPDLEAELYDDRGDLLAERPGLPLGYEMPDPVLYRVIKRLIDPIRWLFAETGSKDARDVKLNLLRKALGGNRGVDYIFSSGDAGDRILYFSYPLRQFTREGPVVRGVLLLEYQDRAAAIIIQKQRNQFALMCLIFLFILLSYLLFILTAFVFPLRKLSRKIQAVANRTEYLLPDDKNLKKNREMGEILGRIDALTEIQNSREQEMEEYVSELKHIIRNPLTIIRVTLEGLLLDRHSDRDRALARIIRNNLPGPLLRGNGRPFRQIGGTETGSIRAPSSGGYPLERLPGPPYLCLRTDYK